MWRSPVTRGVIACLAWLLTAPLASADGLAGLNDWNGVSLPAFTASRLSWAVDRGAFAPVQIQPGRTYYLDVAWRAHGDPVMPPDELRIASALDEGRRDTTTPDWGVRQDFIALRPGYYLVEVRLLASEYDPLDLAYILHWPGAGREDDVELREVPAKV